MVWIGKGVCPSGYAVCIYFVMIYIHPLRVLEASIQAIVDCRRGHRCLGHGGEYGTFTGSVTGIDAFIIDWIAVRRRAMGAQLVREPIR